MPQPETLIGSLGALYIIATEKGYKIVDRNKSETLVEVQEPFSACAATNMQRAMLRAQQIMDAQEDSADGKAATEAMCNSAIEGWDEAKKSLGI